MIVVKSPSANGQRRGATSRIADRPGYAVVAYTGRSVSETIVRLVLLALFFLLPATALALGVFSARPAFSQQPLPGSPSVRGGETETSTDTTPVGVPTTGQPSVATPSVPTTNGASTYSATGGTTTPILRIQEAQLQTYLLPDKDGNLQAVLGFSFERFLELYKIQQSLAPRDLRPLTSFQHLSATGYVVDDRAILDIQIRLLLRDETWVSVPLHLNEAILREPLEDSIDSEQFVEYDPGKNGYVLWIRGKTGQHLATLKMIVPLRTVGDQTQLRLFLPRTTSSEIRLTVPKTKLTASVSEGATLQPPSERGNTTELVALAQGGEFQLTWGETQGRPAAELRQSFEVMETLLTQINRGNIVTEGTLSVRGFGVPFDRLVVRLPVNATLVSEPASNYSVTLLPDTESTVDGVMQLAEIRLNQKTTGPIEIRLAVSQPFDLASSSEPVSLTGFEVVNAVRQWGHVAITAPSQWQVLWQSVHGARRIDQLPDSLRREDVVAGFAIDVASYQLLAKLEPKQTRIDVEPEYLVSIFEDRERLQARFSYTVRGANVETLRLDMSGWKLESVSPSDLVDQDGIIEENGGTVLLPLVQPRAGRFELKLTATREIEPTDGRIEFSLPKPLVDSSGPLAIVLAPADNILLIPDDKSTKGMIRQPVASTLLIPKLQQDPLQYRGDSLDAFFAADVRVMPRKIDVESISHIELGSGSGSYEQILSYTILNEPTDHFDVLAPRGLFESGTLEFFLDDKPLRAVVLNEEVDQATDAADEDNADRADASSEEQADATTETSTDESTPAAPENMGNETAGTEAAAGSPESRVAPTVSDGSAGTEQFVRIRISLPEAKIGFCRILARYPLTWKVPSTDRSTTMSVHNIVPITDQPVRNELTVSTLPQFEATLDSPGWIRMNGTDTSHIAQQNRSEKWISTETASTVELTLQATGEQLSQTLIVDRAWIQTWLSRTTRQDRTVMAITTRADHIRLLIPRGATVAQVFLKPDTADGQWQKAQWDIDMNNKLKISLPGGAEQVQRYILELRTYFVSFPRSEGEVLIELPGVDNDVWLRRLYWQVILPKNEHPVTGVSGFTPEHVWGWNGLFFSRRETMDQAMLEEWVGGIHEPHPPTGVNSYLFGAFGNVRSCHLRTGSRTWIVLAASSIVLLVGLLLIYLPALRHPILLLTGGISLLALGAVFPEPTLFLAQAAALGFVLLLVAALLRYGMKLRRTWPDSNEQEHGSTQTQIPNGLSEPSSTRLVPYNNGHSAGSGSVTTSRYPTRPSGMSGSSHSSRPLR